MDGNSRGPIDYSDGMSVMRYLILDLLLLTNRAVDRNRAIDAHTVRLHQLASPYIPSDSKFQQEWDDLQNAGDERLEQELEAGRLSKRALKSLEAGHRHLEQGALVRLLFRKGILARAPPPRDVSAREKLRAAAERVPLPDDEDDTATA